MTVIRVFGFPWWLCAFVVLVFSALVSLGFWQLGRAEEKREVLASRAKQVLNVELKSLPILEDYTRLRHQRVSLKGRFGSDRQFLLDNQIRHGRVGYSVLTPFQLAQGDWLLVDRGWVEQGLTRQLLPEVQVADFSGELKGEVHVPYGKAYSLGAFNAGSVGWPHVVQFPDFDGMSVEFGKVLLPVVIRMSPESEAGYLREWAVVAMGPEKHVAYAVQWFSMAVVFVILIGIAWRKKV